MVPGLNHVYIHTWLISVAGNQCRVPQAVAWCRPYSTGACSVCTVRVGVLVDGYVLRQPPPKVFAR